jgi:hypothetical protein
VAELVDHARRGGGVVGEGEAERLGAHGAAHLLPHLGVDALEVERAGERDPAVDERLARAVARRDVGGGEDEAGDRVGVAAVTVSGGELSKAAPTGPQSLAT